MTLALDPEDFSPGELVRLVSSRGDGTLLHTSWTTKTVPYATVVRPHGMGRALILEPLEPVPHKGLGRASQIIQMDDIAKMPRIPAFTNMEEAEAWLDANAR